jgi:hypothetical protein
MANAATNMGGVRVNSGVSAITPIDKWGVCRYLQNTSSLDLFVPFGTQTEWLAFRKNYPTSDFVLTHCACPYQYNTATNYISNGLYFGKTSALPNLGDISTDPPDSSVVQPDITTYPVKKMPYGMTGNTLPPYPDKTHTFNYQCKNKLIVPSPTCRVTAPSCCDKNGNNCTCTICTYQGTVCKDSTTNWSETWSFLATAGDSDDPQASPPSWTTYHSWCSGGTNRPTAQCNTSCYDNGVSDCICPTLTPPTLSPDQTCSNQPVCGSANGGTFAQAPTANLCSAGDPSAVSDDGQGHWIWTCTLGGVTTVPSCVANKSACVPPWLPQPSCQN